MRAKSLCVVKGAVYLKAAFPAGKVWLEFGKNCVIVKYFGTHIENCTNNKYFGKQLRNCDMKNAFSS